MKILMLGWEYPPHICGGLGVACEGLSTALARFGVEIDFVLPHVFGDENAGHMRLYDSMNGLQSSAAGNSKKENKSSLIQKHILPSLLSPYLNPQSFDELLNFYRARRGEFKIEELPQNLQALFADFGQAGTSQQPYGTNIFQEVSRYAAQVLLLMGKQDFDVIHAHDWMTFPAAVALARVSGKPLVVHVHSLEYDRSGHNMNKEIHEIEALGISQANTVIAVSYYTASVVQKHHNLSSERIRVVHNGVYSKKIVQNYRRRQNFQSKVVLFLGRVTFQKGPDYFVEAAARCIPHIPGVKFIMAGAGDMLNRMMDRVHQLGISDYFHFPGFLKGEELEEIFSIADLYIMPSVSEPFGISALEAINYDTPVIISKQSGVSEVLSHALKVDFWDIDRMSDLIINGLLHDELRADMLAMAREEVKRLKWEASAQKTLEVYRALF